MQLLCTGASCNSGCTYQSFEEHRCLSMAEGQSGIAWCDNTRGVLMVKNYFLSPNCTGASDTNEQTLGTCYSTVSDNFVEYLCPPSGDKKDEKKKHDRRHHNRASSMIEHIEREFGASKERLQKPPAKHDAHKPVNGSHGGPFVMPRRRRA